MDTRTSWAREVALESEELDREHGMQLALVAALEQALAEGAPAAAISERLEELLEASDLHFGAEELTMRMHSYPRYGVHVEEHRRLVEQLVVIQARHAQGDPSLDLVRDVRRWFVSHVQGMDRDFAEHRAASGAAGGPT